MRMPRSLQWRVAWAYAALILASLAAVGLFLAARPQSGGLALVVAALLAGLVAACLALPLAALLLRTSSRTLRSVIQGARRLAAGDFTHRVEPPAAGEARDVAEAFNQMTLAIRDVFHDLSGERNTFSAVLDTMADGVVLIQSEGLVTLMNRAARELLAIPPEHAVGSRFLEILRDHEIQRLASLCLESGRRQRGDVELLHPRRSLNVVATPLLQDVSGGVLLMFHDLTQARQVETTRREFVTNVSHELRNPLASVKAMVETLEDGALQEPVTARDFLRRINQDVDRMSAMVEDLLELARLESGQKPLSLQPMNLRSLLVGVVEKQQARAQARGVAVEAAVPPDLPPVQADPEKFHQVMVNLLDNALKFTPRDGRVTVGAVVGDGAVEVQVSDTGPGIAPEHLSHVFERFYKVDRARHDGGTGLGLAIVKHIVEGHGGEVSVRSSEGVGSVFSFTLPRAE